MNQSTSPLKNPDETKDNYRKQKRKRKMQWRKPSKGAVPSPLTSLKMNSSIGIRKGLHMHHLHRDCQKRVIASWDKWTILRHRFKKEVWTEIIHRFKVVLEMTIKVSVEVNLRYIKHLRGHQAMLKRKYCWMIVMIIKLMKAQKMTPNSVILTKV